MDNVVPPSQEEVLSVPEMSSPVQDSYSPRVRASMDATAVDLLDYKSYYIIIKAHYKRRIFDPQICNKI